MPLKQPPTQKLPLQTTAGAPGSSSAQPGVGAFLRNLEKPLSEIQKFLTEYPRYEEQFLEHEKAQSCQKELINELANKTKRMKELEGAVAVFEGVHMNNTKAMKEENSRLGQRLTEAKEEILEAEKSSKITQKAFTEKFEKLIKDKKQELDKAIRDHTTAMEKQKIRLEKQHSEIIENNRLQLKKAVSDMEKQNTEMEKLELINGGLRDRASKLKELQQEFSNISDDILLVALSV